MRKVLFLIFIAVNIKVFSQSFEKNLNKLYNYDLNLDISDKTVENYYLLFQKKILLLNILDSSFIKNAKYNTTNKKDSIPLDIMQGDYFLYNYYSKDLLALESYKSALQKALKENDYFLTPEKDLNSFDYYSKLYKSYSYNKYEKAKLHF